MPIKFIESHSAAYSSRTKVNAQADVTLAMAVDFGTAGEVLTAAMVKFHGKKYLNLTLKSLLVTKERVDRIVSALNEVRSDYVRINIAGNGIYSLSISQEELDEFVFNLLSEVVRNYSGFIEIVTGGQTGVDEAGAKAGLKLGLSVAVLFPKGWKFRNKEGKDICSEKLFKSRFE